LLRSDTFPPGEVRWAARSVLGTLIQLPSRLELRHGSSLRSWPLPADASQLEYAEGILVYASGGSIHALRLRDASDRVVLTPPVRPFLVEFSHRGLAWAAGSRVSFRSAATFYS